VNKNYTIRACSECGLNSFYLFEVKFYINKMVVEIKKKGRCLSCLKEKFNKDLSERAENKANLFLKKFKC